MEGFQHPEAAGGFANHDTPCFDQDLVLAGHQQGRAGVIGNGFHDWLAVNSLLIAGVNCQYSILD
jgi:hypothetical protein